MPIYEYECEACSHKLEKLQKIADEPLRVCPECKQASLNKLISAAGFRLKGGGWYETDYKTGNRKNVSGDTPDSGASSDSAGASDSGSSSDSASGESSTTSAATS